jgi:hypothetical protein
LARSVAPVHVVQVNDVGLQSGKAFVDALTHVGGVAADGRPARDAVGRVADMPNLVASVTSSRRSASTLAMSRSLLPPP